MANPNYRVHETAPGVWRHKHGSQAYASELGAFMGLVDVLGRERDDSALALSVLREAVNWTLSEMIHVGRPKAIKYYESVLAGNPIAVPKEWTDRKKVHGH